ncbi:response regulator [Opitutaceae bacterium TAV4]|nr:response regulator [Opitutaceae bacterium TAV4]RRK02484.1 response regulator [Opitutaceae bacterium TAV3]
MNLPWQSLCLFFSTAFELGLALHIWTRLRSPASTPFVLALIGNALWAFLYAIELGFAHTLQAKQLCVQLRFLFIPACGLLWLETAARFCLGRTLFTRPRLAFALLIPIATILLSWFPGPGFNPFFRQNLRIEQIGGLAVLRHDPGPWVALYYCYNYLILTLTVGIVYMSVRGTRIDPVYRNAAIAAIVLFFLGDGLYALDLSPTPGVNYAPILFPITTSLLALGMFGRRVIDLAPIARATLVENLDDRLIVLDENDHVIDLNRAASDSLRTTRSQAFGCPARDILAPWPPVLAHLHAHHPLRTEITLGTHTYDFTLQPATTELHAKAPPRILLLRDITERKQDEHRLRAAKDAAVAADRAQSRFLAMMSHEIRTPMNGVIGFTQLLRDTPLNPRQMEYVDLITRSGQSLLVIIDDILDYSKVSAGHLQLERAPCELRRLIEQHIQLLHTGARQKNITIDLHIDPLVPALIIGDAVRIGQIVSNLVSNAIKFTHHGGVHIHLVPDGPRCLALHVTDTGIGIPPEAHRRIFEPFSQADGSTTRRYGGTGLGLPITRLLCTLMGGTLTLSSQPGHGSTFTATFTYELPSPATRPLNSPAASLPAPASNPRHVLVFEDNPVNRALMSAMLRRLGHTLDFAADGPDGLNQLQHHVYDAILMDIEMPLMDGYEVTRHIRQHEATHALPRRHIIAVTAHAMKGQRELCLAAGMDDYLPKPVNPSDLAAAIARAPSQQLYH